VPARIKLPGGRFRKMPWKTMDAKKKEAQVSATKTNSATKAQGSNGANGAKTNGASAAVPKTNGAQPHAEPQTQPEPQQKINA